MRISLLLLSAAALVRAASDNYTVLNSVIVPPLLELGPDTYEKTISASKLLLVKHFSPYCGHCKEFAPIFQNIYEFYYTSKPGGPDAAGKTFTEYYGLQFATMDCVAFYDTCAKLDVQSYPSSVLFVDGKKVDSILGVTTMALLRDMIERSLEKRYPGTRATPLLLPSPGATSFSAADPSLLPPTESALTPGPLPMLAAVESPASPKPGAQPAAQPAPVLSQSVAASNSSTYLISTLDPSRRLPNADGTSLPLTADTFQLLVTLSEDPWFIKFYAPWCHHCQAMAANWEQMAKLMQGKLNIGEVNCVKEKRFCKEYAVHGYPSIAFFQGVDRADYHGLRGLGDFVSFAENSLELLAGVQDVDASAFKELEDKEDVIFVYFYDHATTSEDFMALDRLPLSLVGHAKIVKTKDPKMFDRFKITTWPRFLVSREGRPTYYTPLTPREMRDVNGLLAWMKSVWVPIVPELTAFNAREIMQRKIVVLGILNRQNQEAFLSAKREIKSAASEWMDRQIQEFQLERQKLRDSKQMRIEEAEDRGDQRALRNAKNIRINMDRSDRKEVAFAWVDGVFWQRWLRTTYGVDLRDGEKIIINDQDNRRYWDATATGNYILVSRTSIMETVDKIIHNPQAIKPKLTINSFEKILFDIQMICLEHPYIAALCVLLCSLLVAQWWRGRVRRNRGGTLRLEDAMGLRKEDIYGSNSNGKVD